MSDKLKWGIFCGVLLFWLTVLLVWGAIAITRGS